MVGPLEQVRVDAERDRWVRVPELARNEHDVHPLSYQERGEAVSERMERKPARRLEAGPLDGIAETVPDVPVVEFAAARGSEDEIVRRFVEGG